MKAIETEYRGYRFRSRLEARWAVFFDALGVEWQYEKEGYDLGELGWYLPDFFLRMSPAWTRRQLHPEAGYWFEVKGIEPTPAELQRLKAVCELTGHHGHLAAGTPGSTNLYFASYVQSRKLSYDPTARHLPWTTVMESLWFDCAVIAPEGMDLPVNKLVAACAAARSARFEMGRWPQ